MTPLKPGDRLVVASHNAGKVWEIHQLIAPFGLEAVSAGELGLPEPEETETTFHGNARLKAMAAANASGLPALADDSGLEVAALGGAPGIYSARWAGPARDFTAAMAKVGEELTARHAWAAPGPAANFISVLCLARPGGEHAFFEGRIDGHLVWPPRGGNGFGYDPMFVPEGGTQTFGEMEPAEKYAISHRTRAFQKFKTECLGAVTGDAPPNADRDKAGLAAAAANISTREELIAFIRHLARDANRDPSLDLATFLKGLETGIEARDVPAGEPVWRTLAKLLLAGRT